MPYMDPMGKGFYAWTISLFIYDCHCHLIIPFDLFFSMLVAVFNKHLNMHFLIYLERQVLG